MLYRSSKLSFDLFADDTNLFTSHKCFDNLIKLFNEELDKVAKLLNINKLSLNVTKTHLNRQNLRDIEINLEMNNSSIYYGSST